MPIPPSPSVSTISYSPSRRPARPEEGTLPRVAGTGVLDPDWGRPVDSARGKPGVVGAYGSSEGVAIFITPLGRGGSLQGSNKRFQFRLQLEARAVEAGSHRPFGDLHDAGDLVVRGALEVLEEDDLAVVLLEEIERLLHLPLGLLQLEALGGIAVLRGFGEELVVLRVDRKHGALVFAAERDRLVERDAVDPGREGGVALE